MAATTAMRWLDESVIGLAREVRLSYLPPLMVYLAAGIAGLTGIVGTFFIKDYLDLSAAFLAGLGSGWASLGAEDAARSFGGSDLALEGTAGLCRCGADRFQPRHHVRPDHPSGDDGRDHARGGLVRDERPCFHRPATSSRMSSPMR